METIPSTCKEVMKLGLQEIYPVDLVSIFKSRSTTMNTLNRLRLEGYYLSEEGPDDPDTNMMETIHRLTRMGRDYMQRNGIKIKEHHAENY